MTKDEKNKNKLPELPKLWRVSISDINHFADIFSITLTVKRLILVCVILLLVSITLGICFVAFTPVKAMLPGFIKSEQRNSFEELSLKYDSLSTVASIQNDYLENIVAIFSDSVTTEIQTLKRDTLGTLNADSILPTSDAERTFVKQYEQREKYNLSVLAPIAAEGMTFFVPVVGAKVSDTTDEKYKGILLITPANASISAICRGTVIAEYYVADQGITVIVQHPRDFVSIYSGISSTYVAKGDKVNAGSRLGVMSANKHTLCFELWHSGTALNPQEYIAFNFK